MLDKMAEKSCLPPFTLTSYLITKKVDVLSFDTHTKQLNAA